MHAKSIQSCPTLCDCMDYSLPGSSVHGILQAWILEWVVIPSSRESSQCKNQTCVSCISCTGRWILYHQDSLAIRKAPPVDIKGKNPPVNAEDLRDAGSIPGSGRSPEGGHGNLPQYSCLENLMDRGAWWAMVYRATKSWTPLKQLRMHTYLYLS